MAAIAEAILNRALRPVFTSLKQALGPEDAKKSIVSVAGGMYMSPSSEYSSPPFALHAQEVYAVSVNLLTF